MIVPYALAAAGVGDPTLLAIVVVLLSGPRDRVVKGVQTERGQVFSFELRGEVPGRFPLSDLNNSWPIIATVNRGKAGSVAVAGLQVDGRTVQRLGPLARDGEREGAGNADAFREIPSSIGSCGA